MSALLALALLAGGLVLVIGGAEVFFDGLLATAARLRISAFAITVVISGLEAENLAAGIAANAKGLPGVAVGTFLGGTTFLALGVAGFGALIAPIRGRLPAPALLWTAAAPLPLVLVSLDGDLSRLDGALLVVWFFVAVIGLARSGPEVVSEPEVVKRRGALLRLVSGLGVLTLGGAVLGEGIHRVVSQFSISQTLLGNTAIAASVEAEELGRVAVPAKRGRGDIALGNISGTIVHFIALNAGIIALVRPLPLDAETLHLHLPVAAGATAFLSTLVWLRNGLGRREGGGLVALYVLYVAVAIAVAV